MKKGIKKLAAICISAIMALSALIVPVSAEGIGEFEKTKIISEMEAAGYRLMSDAEVAEMYLNIGVAARAGVALPYSGDISYTGTADAAYSPIFDVSGEMSNTTKIKMEWKAYDGKSKMRTELQLYVPYIGWFDETAKNINTPSATLNYPTTVVSNVTQFTVKFERYQRNANYEITEECSTNFSYTISLA